MVRGIQNKRNFSTFKENGLQFQNFATSILLSSTYAERRLRNKDLLHSNMLRAACWRRPMMDILELEKSHETYGAA